MLIGPTITLKELEEHMNEKINENKMKLNSFAKELGKLRQEFQVTPKMTNDEKTGEEIVNPYYLELIDKIDDTQASIEELNNQNDFITQRLEDLETIEERSLGKIDKTKNKITLSLKECVMLGIEFNKGDENGAEDETK